MKGYIQRMRAVFSQLSDSHSELRDCGPETFRSRCSKSTEDLTSDGEYRAVLVQLTTGAESESRGGREVERRESTRFQSAKNLLKSLRPGHHGWADVTTSPYPDESQNIRPTSEDSLANHYPTLDRRDPHYHSEGKGMKKRKPWTSEKELRTLPSRAEPTSCNIKSSAPKDSISMTDRSQSFQERKRRSSFSSDENVYENMEEQNRNAQGLDQLVRMDRERERRSFRKLTKDSGYETNYAESDYANLESLELSSLNSKDMELGIPTEDYSSVYRSAPQLQERHGESEPGTSNSVLYPQMAALPSCSHRGVKRSDSQGSRSHQHESSTVSPVTLKRYPSSDSLHSYSSAATLTAGSIYSAKSTPTLTGDTDSGSEIRDTGCSEDDNERMVTKKSSVYNYLQSKSDLCFAPVTTQPYWEKVENHEPVESHEAYVSHLRSSSYQLLQSRSQAQVSPLSESSSSNYYHVRQSSASSSHSQDEGIIPCRRNREKCCPPPSPSCLSPSQSSPPLPPQRDASSLRYINYGPGHEKYPSWPVPSPQNEEIQGAPPVKNNGGSFRSKSWTEQTDYPKERSPGYARPWKKAKQAPSYFQQLKTVVESGTERGSNSNNYYGAYLPPVDRDGKFYGDSDYNIPSPPERDPGSNSSCSYVSEEKRREPVTEETLALLAEKEGALSTPFLDQLRRERENCLVHQWSVNLKEDRDRDGRESVVTNSSNSSSNETLKCHGSLSDLSVCPCPTSIAHSARVPPPQRHQSECVLYYGAGAGIQNPSSTKTVHLGLSPIGESPPAVDVSAPPSVAQRIHDLERQSKSVPNLLGVKPDPSPVKPSLSNQRYKSAGERLKCYLSTVTTCKTEGKSYTYFDPEKKHKVSDPTLKAIQKQAVMQFFERQTGKQLGKNHLRAPRIQTLAREIKKTGSELEAEAEDEPNLRDESSPQDGDADSGLASPVSGEHSLGTDSRGSRSFSPEGIERTGEEMRIQSPGREKTQEAESRPPERPPKKLVLNGETGKGKPRAPSPPRCSTPELPPPPPPPPRDEDVISCDDPLPPPPSPGQVRSLLHASPTLAMYHKDSYMAHRKERMMYSTSFEERYGRRTIAPASHTGPSLHPTRTSMSPSAWEKYHNIRQQSTTVVFTSAELEALKEKERRLKEAKQRLLLTGSGCGNTSSPSLKSLGANSPSPPPTYLRQASSPLPANAESFFPTSSSPKRTRSDEEEECLRLSRDLISHLPDDDRLHRLLMPWSGEKTSADYVVGLFQVPSDLDEGNRRLHGRPPRTRKSKSNIPQVIGSDVAKAEGLPADSSYFTTSEEKAKFFSHYWSDLKVHDQVKIEDSKELLAKKEELLQRIEEKLGVLREERKLLEEETIGNEALGRNITIKVQALAQQREKDKFIRHLEEIEKITSLLLGLSGRLARAENALNESRSEERKTLESKREKLKEQLEEAKHLKEGIDRRSKQIALFLAKYLTVEELADYDHFVKMKAKLIMDSREMEEKIKLGEEQLNALKDALNPNK